MNKINNFLVALTKRPWLVFLAVLLVTLFLGNEAYKGLWDTQKEKLVIDSTLEPLMAKGSEEYDFFKQMRNVYGNEDILVVALQKKDDTPFDLDFFLKLDDLTNKLKSDIPAINSVDSLTTTPRTKGDCQGDSFFHLEGTGGTCQSVLQDYRNRLECIESQSFTSTSSDAFAADDGPGDIYSDDPMAEEGPGDIYSESEAASDPFSEEGPGDIYSDTASDPFDEGAPDDPFSDTASADEETVSAITEDSFVCTATIAAQDPAQLKRDKEEVVARIFEDIKKETLIYRDFISLDFKTAGMIISFREDVTPSDEEIMSKLENMIREFEGDDLRIAYTGQPRTEYQGAITLGEDIAKILPISIGLMLVILALSFRTIAGTFIPLFVVIIGIIWTAGFYGMAGLPLNVVTMILPPLLICVGTAYIIHMLNQYYLSHKEVGKDGYLAAIKDTLHHLTTPLIATAVTTLVGFAALMVSPIPGVKQMGLYACVGVAIVILLTLTLVPAILAVLPTPKIPVDDVEVKQRGLDRFLDWFATKVTDNSRKFVRMWIVIGVVFFIGVMMVWVDSQPFRFPADSQFEKDREMIETKLATTGSMRLIFQGKESADQLQTAKTIYGVIKFKNWLMQKEGTNELAAYKPDIVIHKVYSVDDYIDLWRNGLDNLSDAEVVNYFIDAKKKNFPKYLSDDKQYLQMNMRLEMNSTARFFTLKEEMEQKLKEFLPHLDGRLTGGAILTAESATNIASGQKQSIIIALAMIFLIMSLQLFSFKLGFYALYPNIAAIVLFFGSLGWTNTPLSVLISLIATIALGLGVDDTMHFLAHFNHNVNKYRDEKKASKETLKHMGKAMIFTTISLSVGFAIFGMAQLEDQKMFGILTAATVLVCLATDLNFMPAFMATTKLVTAWDYLALKYDETFLKGIDLFKGMTVRETKIATLMAYSHDLKKDEVLFEESEMGHELFIILDGAIEIYLSEKYHGKDTSLAVLEKGKAFGEMGLFRRSKRAASARAATDTKLLVLNETVLFRLQKRYPKIATKLFLNLAAGLGESVRKSDYRLAEKVAKGDRIKSFFEGSNDKSIKELVDEFIADGVLSNDEKKELDNRIYEDHEISPEEKEQLDRLNKLIEDGTIKQEAPAFVNILQNMKPAQFKWLKSHFELKEIPADSRVFSQGDFGDYMMIVVEGKFNINVEMEGIESTLATVFEGELIGALSLLTNDTTRQASVRAVVDSKVLFISMKGFMNMLDKNKRLAALFSYNLVCILSNRLEDLNKKLYD